MIEIERKFLVTSDAFLREAVNSYRISQGYLNTNPERTVRVRLKDKKGYITIKGKSNAEGTTRSEWEYNIPESDAKELLKVCEPVIIEKVRYEIPYGHHVFEVDVFLGSHQGLVIAEIELSDADESFPKPEWLGEEVTGDNKYYNAFLSKSVYPFD
ncbi:MAG: CYTH domain-containing protein [Flavobacterium sp.]